MLRPAVSDCLVVDDNPALAAGLAQALSTLGHRVEVVDAGDAALERVSAHRYDVVLTDHTLPGMSGEQFMQALRAVDAQVAVMVTCSEPRQAHPLLRYGVLGTLAKPVAFGDVNELVQVARRDALLAIVEDDLLLADNLCDLFRAAGFAPVHAASLAELDALPALDLVAAVVDLRVPGGPDGEALRRLRRRYPALPLLAMSGFDLEPPVPLRDFFPKPANAGALLNRVEVLHGQRA